LSGNSIETLNVNPDNENQMLFLPMLAYLKLHRNKISFEDGLGCYPISACTPLLLELKLSHNLISNTKILTTFLDPLLNLKRLVLGENLLSPQEEEQLLAECQERGFEVFFSDDAIITSPSKTLSAISEHLSLPPIPSVRNLNCRANKDLYLNMAEKQRKEYFEFVQSETKELKNLRGWKMATSTLSIHNIPPDFFAYHCDYLQKYSELSIQHRYVTKFS